MRKFVILIVVVLVVAGAWTGAWFYGAGEINHGISALAAGDGDASPKLTCGRQNVTGFPFRFDIACEDATLLSGDMTMTLGGFRASVLAYNPTHAKFSALAPLTLSDAFSGARSRIAFDALEGSAQVVARDLMQGLGGDGWRIGRISVIADGVAWTDTVVGEVPVLSAERIEAHLTDVPAEHRPETGTASLAAHLALSEVAAPGYAIEKADAAIAAEITGLPDDLRALGADDALARWQKAGGQLELVSLKGTAGEDFVESSGALGLDSGARLDGQVRLKSRGLIERLGGLIPEDWKGLIVGGEEADGSYSQVLTVKAGVVFSGFMPITVIPPLLADAGG